MTPAPDIAAIEAEKKRPEYQQAVLDLLPNCQFLLDIEDFIYSGKGRNTHITQGEFYQLMSDVRQAAAALEAERSRVRELEEAMRWRKPEEWNHDVWPKRIWVTDGRQAHVINMEHHQWFPVGQYCAWMPLPPVPDLTPQKEQQ